MSCSLSFDYSWLKEKEKRLLSSVEFKIDNFDARNMRQLNQLYEEIKKIEGTKYLFIREPSWWLSRPYFMGNLAVGV